MGVIRASFGFLGDFFLPKHIFRFAGRVGREVIPAGQGEEKPDPKRVFTNFAGQASKASQVIADRVFSGRPWATRRIPMVGLNFGGATILASWLVVVGLLSWCAYARLVSGIRETKPMVLPVKAPVQKEIGKP